MRKLLRNVWNDPRGYIVAATHLSIGLVLIAFAMLGPREFFNWIWRFCK